MVSNLNEANKVKDKYEKLFSEWKSDIVFETPNYKVRVGRFKDLNIASQKLEEIRKYYPSAFLLEPNNL